MGCDVEENTVMARLQLVMSLVDHATGGVNSAFGGNRVGGWGVLSWEGLFEPPWLDVP